MFKRKGIATKASKIMVGILILLNPLITTIHPVLATSYPEGIAYERVERVEQVEAYEISETKETLETKENVYATFDTLPEVQQVEELTKTEVNATSNQVRLIDIFEDENLAWGVGWELGFNMLEVDVSDIEIDFSDLLSVTILQFQRQIQSLNGIEHLTNLEVLNIVRVGKDVVDEILEPSDISDISLLTNLPNLYLLGLQNTQISDISPLANLTNLEFLNLSHSQISDISPLSSLPSLTNLNLNNNQISDISPLINLTNNLRHIHLGGNQISDITPLVNLTNFTSLNLSNNQISDISPLSNLIRDYNPNTPWLSTLDLNENHISDFRPLSNLIENNPDMLRNRDLLALNQSIFLDETTLGTATPFSLHMPDRIIPILTSDSQFTLENGLLTWHTGGNNLLEWTASSNPGVVSFSGIVYQTIPLEIDPISIEAIRSFLNANTIYNRVVIPANAITESEIISAITAVLNGIDGLNDDITVTLIRQDNTTFTADQINNITVELSINPTYSFTNQTIYFRHATTNNNNNENNNLPQTGAITSSLIGVGALLLSGGAIATFTKSKKKG